MSISIFPMNGSRVLRLDPTFSTLFSPLFSEWTTRKCHSTLMNNDLAFVLWVNEWIKTVLEAKRVR